ncbi:antitoxin MazE-like protein [Vibrio furnissii]|uniref:antitoxin MazE-like protein n=2 Tax=Vibrio furnissii TaxID=29494 RepID=UPI003AA86EFC
MLCRLCLCIWCGNCVSASINIRNAKRKGIGMSKRNKRYEDRMREQGLEKVTLWVPSNLKSEFQSCAERCRTQPTLSLSLLRDTATGRFVSLEK